MQKLLARSGEMRQSQRHLTADWSKCEKVVDMFLNISFEDEDLENRWLRRWKLMQKVLEAQFVHILADRGGLTDNYIPAKLDSNSLCMEDGC